MNSDSNEYGIINQSFCVKFIISNDTTTARSSNSVSSDRSIAPTCQDVEHLNHSSFTRQNETSSSDTKLEHIGPHEEKKGGNASNNSDKQNKRSERKQIFISPESSQCHITGSSPTSPPTPDSLLDTSSYELIDWEEEKKAIEEEEEKEYRLRDRTCSSRTSRRIQDYADIARMSHSCNFIKWSSATHRRAASVTPSAKQTPAGATKDDTSSRLNSPSVTSTICSGTAPTAKTGKRASSSDELDRLEPEQSSLLASHRSTSGNHLAIGASVETVCGTNQTQANIVGRLKSGSPARPLEIEIDSPQMDQLVSPFGGSTHPLSLDDILKIDMDNLRFEEECKTLEAEAQYWEQKVENLERQQFAEDVPRTLVDSIIKHRKELRELECEMYKRALDSEGSDVLSCEGKNMTWLDDTSPSELQSPIGNKYTDYMNEVDCIDNQLVDDMDEGLNLGDPKVSRKYKSHLKPGQENTADILDAVPPSGSLQRRHYLNKATTGTDTSEYSQLPTFNQHGHKIIRQHRQLGDKSSAQGDELFEDEGALKSSAPPHQQHRPRHNHNQHRSSSSSSSSQHRISRRHMHQQHRHQQHQQLYVQLDNSEASNMRQRSPNHRSRESPIRPDHFKSDFRSPQMAAARDSSSTTSSSSPQ